MKSKFKNLIIQWVCTDFQFGYFNISFPSPKIIFEHTHVFSHTSTPSLASLHFLSVKHQVRGQPHENPFQ